MCVYVCVCAGVCLCVPLTDFLDNEVTELPSSSESGHAILDGQVISRAY